MPQPQSQAMVDECPVVELSDSSEDWDEFLPILYSIRRCVSTIPNTEIMGPHASVSSIHEPRSNATKQLAIPLNLMLAMLTLGHKYDFKSFLPKAIAYLKTLFPLHFPHSKNSGSTVKMMIHIGKRSFSPTSSESSQLSRPWASKQHSPPRVIYLQYRLIW